MSYEDDFAYLIGTRGKASGDPTAIGTWGRFTNIISTLVTTFRQIYNIISKLRPIVTLENILMKRKVSY